MKDELLKLKEQFIEEIALVKTLEELTLIKSKYLGKKSRISEVMASMKRLQIEEKKEVGTLCNKLKNEITQKVKEKNDELISKSTFDFDLTMPISKDRGSLNPITVVGKEVCDILQRLGFTIVSGPEIEDEYHNFDALNIPSSHPARDMQDTYWTNSGKLLRTHTSPCQVRAMEKYGAPLRIAAPGRCF